MGDAENRGDPEYAKSMYAEASKLVKHALVMEWKLFPGKGHPSVATTLHELGLIYFYDGNYTKARTYFQKSLEMERAIRVGQDHIEVAVELDMLGAVNIELGEFTE